MSFLSGLFGGNSSSSSTSANNYSTPQNVQSNTAPVVTGSNNSLTLTDARSAQYAAALADKALGTVQASTRDLAANDAALTLGVIDRYTQASAASFATAVTAAQKTAQQDTTTISNNLVKYGGLALVALVALAILGG